MCMRRFGDRPALHFETLSKEDIIMDEQNTILTTQSSRKPDGREDLDDLIFAQEGWLASDR